MIGLQSYENALNETHQSHVLRTNVISLSFSLPVSLSLSLFLSLTPNTGFIRTIRLHHVCA